MARGEETSLLCAEDALGLEASPLLGEMCRLYGDFDPSTSPPPPPPPSPTEECVAAFLQRESEHAPAEGYPARLAAGDVAAAVRRHAVEWIGKVRGHYGFAPVTAALAFNYLDRFLSLYVLPEGKAWMAQLLSVACLSLAAKMEESLVPTLLDLQDVGEAKFLFEGRTVQRLELIVGSTLNWRLQAVTPFSYIDYFLDKFNSDKMPSMRLTSQSTELILSTTTGTDFFEYRPSEIAAAVALSALMEHQDLDIQEMLARCSLLNEERVLKCYEVIQDRILIKSSPAVSNALGSSILPVPRSPSGVLDATCLSHSSDDQTVGSHTACYHSTPASKRRKIGGLLIP